MGGGRLLRRGRAAVLLVVLAGVVAGCARSERAPEETAEDAGPRSAEPETSAPAPPWRPLRLVRGQPAPAEALSQRMEQLGVSAVSVATFDAGGVERTWVLGEDARGAPIEAGTAFPGGAITDELGAALIAVGVLRWAVETGTDLEAKGVRASAPAIERRRGFEAPTIAQLLGHLGGLSEESPPSSLAPSARLRALASGPGGTLPVVERAGRRFLPSPAGVLLLRQLLLEPGELDLQPRLAALVLAPAGLTATRVGEPPAAWATAIPPTVPGAASADLWTTPSDVARLILATVDSARGVDADPLLPWPLARRALERGPGGFGWGWRIVEPGPRIEIAVGGLRAATRAIGFIESRQGVVVMTAGGRAEGRADWLAREIVAGWAERRGWPGFESVELEATPSPSQARAIAGTYRFDEKELVVRVAPDGRLLVESGAGVLGAEPLSAPIYPLGALSFGFLDRSDTLDFVARGGEIRGVRIGDQRGLRVPDGA